MHVGKEMMNCEALYISVYLSISLSLLLLKHSFIFDVTLLHDCIDCIQYRFDHAYIDLMYTLGLWCINFMESS